MYGAMLASIADAVVAVDTLGQISFLNAAAEAVTGWTRDEAMGRPVQDVLRMMAEATREEMESPAVRALRRCAAEPATDDALLIDRQGAAIPVASSAAPVLDARGRLSGAVVVMRDLRERRRLQAALHAATLQTAKGKLVRRA